MENSKEIKLGKEFEIFVGIVAKYGHLELTDQRVIDEIANEIDCSSTLLREVIIGKVENISNATLDKILNSLK